MNIIFEVLEGGYDKNLSYIIGDTNNSELSIVDASIEYSAIKEILKQYPQHKLTKILLTHAHFDHITSLTDLLIEEDNIELIAHPEALEPLSKQLNIRKYTQVKHDDIIHINNDHTVKVIHTPGHQPECICFDWIGQKKLFTGDTLFVDACGRCDLPRANPMDQYYSLEYLYDNIDGHTLLHAGHDYGHAITDDFRSQKRNNRYLTIFQDQSISDSERQDLWIKTRMR